MASDISVSNGNPSTRARRRARHARSGRVVFDPNQKAIHCAISQLTDHEATITLTGWLAFPAEFDLYVEPDRLKARCKVLQRKGSSVRVSLSGTEENVRYRHSA